MKKDNAAEEEVAMALRGYKLCPICKGEGTVCVKLLKEMKAKKKGKKLEVVEDTLTCYTCRGHRYIRANTEGTGSLGVAIGP